MSARITPADVAAKQFHVVRMERGYRIEEVDAYLEAVGAEITTLLGERAGVITASSAAPAETVTQDTAEVLRMAQQVANQVRSQAEGRAQRMINEAFAKAKDLITEAEINVEAHRAEAAQIQIEIDGLAAHEASVRAELATTLRTHLATIEGTEPSPPTAAPATPVATPKALPPGDAATDPTGTPYVVGAVPADAQTAPMKAVSHRVTYQDPPAVNDQR